MAEQPQPASPQATGSAEDIVRSAARKYGLDEDYFVSIAMCESTMNPTAVNYGYSENGNPSGLFQHLSGYWPEEAILTLFRPFGIDRIVVGRAVANTGKEGVSDTFTSVWGKNAWLGYVTNKPGRKTINGGYKFRLQDGREATREYMNNPAGAEVLVRDQYDHVIMETECFYLIKNAVA